MSTNEKIRLFGKKFFTETYNNEHNFKTNKYFAHSGCKI